MPLFLSSKFHNLNNLIFRLLTRATTKGSEIRFQDSSKVFTYVHQASLTGVDTVLEFVKKNYLRLKR